MAKKPTKSTTKHKSSMKDWANGFKPKPKPKAKDTE